MSSILEPSLRPNLRAVAGAVLGALLASVLLLIFTHSSAPAVPDGPEGTSGLAWWLTLLAILLPALLAGIGSGIGLASHAKSERLSGSALASGALETRANSLDSTQSSDAPPTGESQPQTKLQDVLSLLPEALLVVGEDTEPQPCNAAARTLWPELQAAHGEMLFRWLVEIEAGRRVLSLEDGRWLEIEVQALPSSADRLISVRDLSATRRLQQRSRDLVANVSHELKTPLTAIRAAAETLSDGAADDAAAAQRFLWHILEQCERLELLLRDLLTLARLEGEDAARAREAVDFARVAERALRLLTPQAARMEVTLTVSGEAPLVHADPAAMERLLINLLDNAIKYNRRGGKVELHLGREGEAALLRVLDTGVGIPESDLERVFERFYRVDKGRARAQGGTGLGLAMVKHAALAQGGEVRLSSRLGVGSEFRVLLPLQPPASGTSAQAGRTAELLTAPALSRGKSTVQAAPSSDLLDSDEQGRMPG